MTTAVMARRIRKPLTQRAMEHARVLIANDMTEAMERILLRRLHDIKTGKAKTIPLEEVWRELGEGGET